MECKYPQTKMGPTGKMYSHPCGQCMPCRVTHKQTWASRILLESHFHAESVFLTLTYSPEHYPVDGSLDKNEVQLWLKRLRKALHPQKIRYYACGEYGERSGRAHYHAVIFNCSINQEDTICKSWQKGYVQVSPLTSARAEYVAKYMTKAQMSPSSSQDGRAQEFALMSRRPGIGSEFAQAVLKRCESNGIAPTSFHTYADPEKATMPIYSGSVRVDGRLYPLGNYLKQKLKTEGFDNDLYLKSLESKSLETSGGSVFEEVLKRADAKIGAHRKIQLLKQKRRNRSLI